MAGIIEQEAELGALVRSMRSIAVVGIKDGEQDPDAPAYSIPLMLATSGHRVIGINPFVPEALGHATLASVGEMTEAVDVLDVFRRVTALPELAEQLLAMPASNRPRAVWFQSGIRHDGVAAKLSAAGMDVVQDRCLGVYARRYR
ncbi:MAG: CoA-binding protein [Candidatus Eisenbacteria bacterium]